MRGARYARWARLLRAGIPLLGLALLAASCPSTPGPSLDGTWRAVLGSPGGDLPFSLEIRSTERGLEALGRNGAEEVHFTSVTRTGSGLVLRIDGYDSEIQASLDGGADRMSGEWTRTSLRGGVSRLPFQAVRGDLRRFAPEEPTAAPGTRPETVDGVWAVIFRDEEGEELAQAEFRQEGARVVGTFLTPVGDYRYLEGDYRDGLLRLSCFDGAHAFLFRASASSDETLEGDFWSRDSYHATWSARRVDEAGPIDVLPDPFELVGLTNTQGRLEFVFPDLDGKPISLADDRFRGRVVIVNLFGSWCPNCNDEAPQLAAWHREHRERGLEVVGLAYEFTGERERDMRFVRKYRDRHDIEYSLLLAGVGDKSEAAESLPDLTGIVAFPTTIFVGRDGKVRRIHSGYAGPATGEHHRRMIDELESIIETLLAETVSVEAPTR